MISAKVVADSISPAGKRLTTMEVVMPRMVLAEFNTHRAFSRNSASSRAIPVEKMIQRVMEDPFVPLYWGKNQKGMQADEELDSRVQNDARMCWLQARDKAIEQANLLLFLGVHKQITNRLLEPFLWHTVIVTATEWSNFFSQRCHPDAMPEMRLTAEAMMAAYMQSQPKAVAHGQWHLPYVTHGQIGVPEPSAEVLYNLEDAKKVSVARCARVSYLQHDGVRDWKKDIELYERLVNGMHWSPFEHVATPMLTHPKQSNFRGWHQLRKEFPNECR